MPVRAGWLMGVVGQLQTILRRRSSLALGAEVGNLSFMPEALAVIFVLLVSVIIYVVARVQAVRAPRDPERELAHLQHHHTWLAERQLAAERDQWDDVMKARLAQQLAETRRKIHEVTAWRG